MAHKLVGLGVTYMRPVDAKGKRTLVETDATVIGVEPEGEASPRLHLAFVHPDRVDSLTGSGWRDAFDRAVSVRPQSDPLVAANPNLPYYEDNAEPATVVLSEPQAEPVVETTEEASAV